MADTVGIKFVVDLDAEKFRKELKRLTEDLKDPVNVKVDFQDVQQNLNDATKSLTTSPVRVGVDVDRLRRDIQANKLNVKLDPRLTKDVLVDSFSTALKDSLKGLTGGNLLSGLFSGLFSGFDLIFGKIVAGALEAAGEPLGLQLGAGISRSLDNLFGNAFGSLELLGEKISTNLFDSIISASDALEGKLLKGINKFFSSDIKPGLLGKATRLLIGEEEVQLASASRQMALRGERQAVVEAAAPVLEERQQEQYALREKLQKQILKGREELKKNLETRVKIDKVYNKAIEPLQKKIIENVKKLSNEELTLRANRRLGIAGTASEMNPSDLSEKDFQELRVQETSLQLGKEIVSDPELNKLRESKAQIQRLIADRISTIKKLTDRINNLTDFSSAITLAKTGFTQRELDLKADLVKLRKQAAKLQKERDKRAKEIEKVRRELAKRSSKVRYSLTKEEYAAELSTASGEIIRPGDIPDEQVELVRSIREGKARAQYVQGGLAKRFDIEEFNKLQQNLAALNSEISSISRYLGSTRDSILKAKPGTSLADLTRGAKELERSLVRERVKFDSPGGVTGDVSELTKSRRVLADVLNTVAKNLGVSLDVEDLPGLGVLPKDENPDRLASFSSKENVVKIREDLLQGFLSGNVSNELANALAHELVHALQSGLGRVDLTKSFENVIARIEVSEAERLAVQDRVRASVPSTRGNRRALLELETQAYALGDRLESDVKATLEGVISESRITRTLAELRDAGRNSISNIDKIVTEAEKELLGIAKVAIDRGADKDKTKQVIQVYREILTRSAKSLREGLEGGLTESIKTLQNIDPNLEGLDSRLAEIHSALVDTLATSIIDFKLNLQKLTDKSTLKLVKLTRKVSETRKVSDTGGEIPDPFGDVPSVSVSPPEILQSSEALASSIATRIEDTLLDINSITENLNRKLNDAIKAVESNKVADVSEISKRVDSLSKTLSTFTIKQIREIRKSIDGARAKGRTKAEIIRRLIEELGVDVLEKVIPQTLVLDEETIRLTEKIAKQPKEKLIDSINTAVNGLVDSVRDSIARGDVKGLAQLEADIQAARQQLLLILTNTTIRDVRGLVSGKQLQLSNLREEARLNRQNLEFRGGRSGEPQTTSVIRDLTKEVARLSGVDLNLEDLPRVVEKSLEDGAKAAFNVSTNELELSRETIEKLRSGVFNADDISDVIHELRHAIQTDFGRKTISEASGSISAESVDEVIQDAARKSAELATDNVERQKEIMKLEADAYEFQLRYSEQIAARLSSDSERLFSVGIDGIRDRLSQLEREVTERFNRFKRGLGSLGQEQDRVRRGNRNQEIDEALRDDPESLRSRVELEEELDDLRGGSRNTRFEVDDDIEYELEALKQAIRNVEERGLQVGDLINLDIQTLLKLPERIYKGALAQRAVNRVSHEEALLELLTTLQDGSPESVLKANKVLESLERLKDAVNEKDFDSIADELSIIDKGFKALGVSSKEVSNLVGESTSALERGVVGVGNAANKAFKSVDNFTGGFLKDSFDGIVPRLRGIRDGLLDLAKGFLAFQVFTVLENKLEDIARESLVVTRRFEALGKRLQFAVGNSDEILDRLFVKAQDLGVNFESLSDGFAGFASAVRGTSLEGDAEAIFDAVAKASAAMQMSAEQTQGTFVALQQMASKGVVSAEEFRGQLAERLPAGLQVGVAALQQMVDDGVVSVEKINKSLSQASEAQRQAYQVTASDFTKFLNSGQLIAADFLPRFAEKLSGISEVTSSSLEQATQRINNSFVNIQRTIGDLVAPAVIASLEETAKLLNTVAENGDLVVSVFRFLGTTALYFGGVAAIKFVMGAKGIIGSLLGMNLSAQTLNISLLTANKAMMALVVGSKKLLAASLPMIGHLALLAAAYYTVEQAARAYSDVIASASEQAALFSTMQGLQTQVDTGGVVSEEDLSSAREEVERLNAEMALISPPPDVVKNSNRALEAIKEEQRSLLNLERRRADLLKSGGDTTEIDKTIKGVEETIQEIINAEKGGFLGLQGSGNDLQQYIDLNKKAMEGELARLEAITEQSEKNDTILREYNSTLLALQQSLLSLNTTELEKLAEIQESLRDGGLSYLEAEERISETQLETSKERLNLLEEELELLNATDLAKLPEQQRNEATQRLIDLESEIPSLRADVAEQEIRVKETQYKNELHLFEEQQNDLRNRTKLAETQRLTEVQQLRNEGLIDDLAVEDEKLSLTQSRIESELKLEEEKIERLRKLLSEQVSGSQASEDLSNQIEDSLQSQADLIKELAELEADKAQQAVKHIQNQVEISNDGIESQILGLEAQTQALEHQNKLIDARVKIAQSENDLRQSIVDLEQARFDLVQSQNELELTSLNQALELTKLISDARVGDEVRGRVTNLLNQITDGNQSELDLIESRNNKEDEIRENKLKQLEIQYQSEKAQLDFEEQQLEFEAIQEKNRINALKVEAQINNLKAEQAINSALGAKAEALKLNDVKALRRAELAITQAQLQRQQAANLGEQAMLEARASSEVLSNQREALNNRRDTARVQHENAMNELEMNNAIEERNRILDNINRQVEADFNTRQQQRETELLNLNLQNDEAKDLLETYNQINLSSDTLTALEARRNELSSRTLADREAESERLATLSEVNNQIAEEEFTLLQSRLNLENRLADLEDARLSVRAEFNSAILESGNEYQQQESKLIEIKTELNELEKNRVKLQNSITDLNESNLSDEEKSLVLEGIRNDLTQNNLDTLRAELRLEDELLNLDKLRNKQNQERVEANLQNERSLLDARSSATAAQSDLNMAIQESMLSGLDRRIEMAKLLGDNSMVSELEEEKLQKQLQLESLKQQQLTDQQKADRERLENERRIAELKEKQLVAESELERSKAERAVLEAQQALTTATGEGDAAAISAATEVLSIAQEGLSIANSQVDLARERLKVQEQITQSQLEALDSTQQAAQIRANDEREAVRSALERAQIERRNTLRGGFRVSGGGVGSGKSYTVGERGVELYKGADGSYRWLGLNGQEEFIPQSPGNIIPNARLEQQIQTGLYGSDKGIIKAVVTGFKRNNTEVRRLASIMANRDTKPVVINKVTDDGYYRDISSSVMRGL